LILKQKWHSDCHSHHDSEQIYPEEFVVEVGAYEEVIEDLFDKREGNNKS